MKRRSYGNFIVADPKIGHGKLTFVGTRIFVKDVLELVAQGMDWDSVTRECHGFITREAIAEAVSLARQALMEHEEEYGTESVPA